MINIAKLANPSFFMTLSGRMLPWLAAVAAVLFAAGVYLSLTVPGDYQQGETVRIMFVHVPAAWLGMACYMMITVSSIGSLIWRHPLADVSAKAAVPIGGAFTLVALVTGALWGKPMWGAYWVWDARLTSMLILFFLYLGLLAMWHSFDDQGRAGRAAAILAIVGSVNIPIIKFSVDWWNTLHQPSSVMKMSGPAMPAVYLAPLLIMAVAFTVLMLWLHMKGMRAEILKRRVETLMITRVSRAAGLKTAEAAE